MTDRPFSRDMPPCPPPAPPGSAWADLLAGALALLLLTLLAVSGYEFVRAFLDDPAGTTSVASVFVFGFWLLHHQSRLRYEARVNRLLMNRPPASICAFARSFDRRTTDPWITRALWDELQELAPRVPLRAEDDLLAWMGPDDLEEAIGRVARRAGYRDSGWERNSHSGPVRSARDVSRLVAGQPRA